MITRKPYGNVKGVLIKSERIKFYERKEKVELVRQASKLYTLGLTVEKHREKLRQLVEKKIPYDSPKMKATLEEFQKADEEWKRLEQEHLAYRKQLGIDP